ncbi:Pro-kumamolisin, activation domain-containing protein [Lactarius indigo]|nr:Pro-kumamolisin, activation domain-containing protein [Lactarius indigo]
MRYHQLSLLYVLAVGPLANFARSLAPPWDDIRVKHTWDSVPLNWETLGPPPAGTTIDLHISLKAHHENGLIDALYEVSDPRSPKYGAHLSKEQVAQLVAPRADTVELINSWLEHHDVPPSSISTTHDGSWLTLTGVPVPQANVLLGASYQLYRHTGTNDTTILRTTGYALPAVLHRHVRTIVPTTYFASMHTLQQTPATVDVASRELVTTLSSRNNKITPNDLRSLYKTFLYVPVATKRNKLGVAGFLNQYPSPVDLKTFMTQYRIDADRATFSIDPVNGGVYDPTYASPAAEANMNMQYTQVMAYPTPHTFYVTGGNVLMKGNEPDKGDVWLEWTNYLLGEEQVPQTVCNTYAD